MYELPLNVITYVFYVFVKSQSEIIRLNVPIVRSYKKNFKTNNGLQGPCTRFII